MTDHRPDGPARGSAGDRAAAAKDTALRLLAYCRANDWAGYDPYDALNSRLFRALPFLNFKAARLALTQGVKRSPVNLRPLLLVPRTVSPKGLALFLAALVRSSRAGLLEDGRLIPEMADRLLSLRSPDADYHCWGYNFDWQTRTKLIPQGSPNIICSTFAANALLDAYERLREPRLLEAARSTAAFLTDRLFWRKRGGVACYSYTLKEKTLIHNANLLGAALVARVAVLSGERKELPSALEAARYSVGRQHQDGAWSYGEASFQQWIDNFHTGFNLVALRRVGTFAGTAEFEPSVRLGFQFYRDHFFRADGAPNYFHDSTGPIDIHSVAQSLITLAELRDLRADNMDLAGTVLRWALIHMWDPRGFFYFQKKRAWTVRTPFMRWSEAWMLLALATLLGAEAVAASPDKDGPA